MDRARSSFIVSRFRNLTRRLLAFITQASPLCCFGSDRSIRYWKRINEFCAQVSHVAILTEGKHFHLLCKELENFDESELPDWAIVAINSSSRLRRDGEKIVGFSVSPVTVDLARWRKKGYVCSRKTKEQRSKRNQSKSQQKFPRFSAQLMHLFRRQSGLLSKFLQG